MNAKARRAPRFERQGLVGLCGRILGHPIGPGGGARRGPFFWEKRVFGRIWRIYFFIFGVRGVARGSAIR
jgi:hypothetical protein